MITKTRVYLNKGIKYIDRQLITKNIHVLEIKMTHNGVTREFIK